MTASRAEILEAISKKNKELKNNIAKHPVLHKGEGLDEKKSKERVDHWNTGIKDALQFIRQIENVLGLTFDLSKQELSIRENESKEEKGSENVTVPAYLKIPYSNLCYNILIMFIYKWTHLKNYNTIPYVESVDKKYEMPEAKTKAELSAYQKDEIDYLNIEMKCLAASLKKSKLERIDFLKQIRNGDEESDGLLKQLEVNRGFYQKIDERIEQAKDAVSKVDYVNAYLHFQAALTCYPEMSGDRKASDITYDHYTEIGESCYVRSVWIRTGLANAAFWTGKYDEAHVIYERLIKGNCFDEESLCDYITLCEASYEGSLVAAIQKVVVKCTEKEAECSFEYTIDDSDPDLQALKSAISLAPLSRRDIRKRLYQVSFSEESKKQLDASKESEDEDPMKWLIKRRHEGLTDEAKAWIKRKREEILMASSVKRPRLSSGLFETSSDDKKQNTSKSPFPKVTPIPTPTPK